MSNSAAKIFLHEGKKYLVSEQVPQNGDLVLTEKYDVWEFRDETGFGSAPMPYWANKKACKKLILVNQ